MSMDAASDAAPAAVPKQTQLPGLRKNGLYSQLPLNQLCTKLTFVAGKNWHPVKKAFRPTAGQTPYGKRKLLDQEKRVMKEKEQEMRDEKEQERNRRIQTIKERRSAKEEKERYEKMAEKMHQKLVERRKRREKRNKLLKS